jgi:hypothetical protein
MPESVGCQRPGQRHDGVLTRHREEREVIFDRIGLARLSRDEAHELYTRLATRAI